MRTRNVLRLIVFVGVACLIVAAAIAMSAQTARADAIDATCKISTPTHRMNDGREGHEEGTGTVFQITKRDVFILTVAHVIDGAPGALCEFWKAGSKSIPLPASVAGRDRVIDTAVLSIPAAMFLGILPQAIPLEKESYVPKKGEVICSVGCAHGAWPTEWRGKVVGYDKFGIHFDPTPAEGRSGSAIFNADGTRIIGLLVAQWLNEREQPINGIAMPVANVYRLLNGSRIGQANVNAGWRAVGDVHLVQCTTCPSGGCNTADDTALRRRQQQQQKAPQPVWPQYQPEQSRVDLAPIEQQLADIRGAMATMPAQTIVQAQPDPRVDQALQGVAQAHQRIDGLAGDVKKVGDGVSEIQSTIKPLLKLHEKLEADAEAGGLKGKVAGQILQATEGDADKIHKEMGIVGAVLAIGLLIVFGVLHLLRTGNGPVRELVDKLAAQHPENVRLQALDATLGTVDAKILAAMQPLQQQLHQVALAIPPAAALAGSGTVPSPSTVNINTAPGTPAAAIA